MDLHAVDNLAGRILADVRKLIVASDNCVPT